MKLLWSELDCDEAPGPCSLPSLAPSPKRRPGVPVLGTARPSDCPSDRQIKERGGEGPVVEKNISILQQPKLCYPTSPEPIIRAYISSSSH